MQGIHIHTPGWMHPHKPDWHILEAHIGHLVHDPRFWSALALVVLFGLLVLMAIYTKTTGQTTLPPTYPGYPYMP